MSESSDFNDPAGNGHDPEPVSGTTAAAALAARTLRGDLRDRVLEFVRRQKQPWALLNEEQQTGVVGEVTRIAGELVDGAVAIVATRDFPAITAKVRDCKAGEKGIEAKLVLASHDPFRHALMDAVGSPVQIVLADPAVFYGARGLAAIDRDEPELPLANGAGEPENPAEGPGEVATPASEDGPGHGRDPYSDGYEAAKADAGVDANPYEWLYQEEPEYRAGLCWLAGWHQARIDHAVGTLARNDAVAGAVMEFDGHGRAAAEYDLDEDRKASGVTTACPLADWMPAFKWWTQGYLEACAGAGTSDKPPPSVEPPKSGRGRPRKQDRDQPGVAP